MVTLTRGRWTHSGDAYISARTATILARKVLPVRDACPEPADTCTLSHISTNFRGLAGGSSIDVPRNHGRGQVPWLLDGPVWSDRARFCLIVVVQDVDK